MEKYEINKRIKSFSFKLKNLYTALDVEKLTPQVKELEDQMSSTDFWSNSSNAKQVITKLNNLKEKVNLYNNIKKSFDDLQDLLTLEENDDEMNLLIEEEISTFEKKLDQLELSVILNGKYDSNDAILELHPGAGGTESMDWAEMLYRMFQRYCQKKGFKVTVLDYLPGEEAGIKSVTINVSGNNAYGFLKSESGIHRLVRISPFDSNARRHTSFVSCYVAPVVDDKTDLVIDDKDLKIDVYRSSGAGGQSVNTTDSAVRITHLPTNIVVTCQNERSQISNRQTALTILKSKLVELEIRKKQEEIKNETGSQMLIGFGSQIRSYVFHPYTLVKDHRTNHEVGNINSVMDGEIDSFVIAYLKQNVRS